MKFLTQNTNIYNSVVTLSIRVLGVITLFGLSWFMTNTVDESSVGYYEFARVVLLTIATFGLLGTEHAILYFAGKFEAEKRLHHLGDVYFKMMGIVIVSSIIVCILFQLLPQVFFGYFGIDKDFLSIIERCFLILPFYALTILNTEAIRAFRKIGISEWFRNILKYTPLFIGLLAIRSEWVSEKSLLDWYLYGFVVLAFLSFLVVLLCMYSHKIKRTIKDSPTSKAVLQQSYPMAISAFYTFLLMTIDVFLLGHYYGADYVAYYAIAMKVMSVLSMVIVAVNINFAPKIALYFTKNDQINLQKNLQKTAYFIAITNLILGVLLLAFAPYILQLFGANYLIALPAYYILIVVQIIVSTFGMVPMYMNMTEKQSLFHKIMFVAVVINIILNALFIPKYGLIGAAISYGVTVLFWNIIVAILSFKIDKVQLTIWK